MPSLPDGFRETRIPKGLKAEEREVYERIFKFLEARAGKSPNIVVISDIQKDVDDLVAWTMLAEMHRLGVIALKGFVANFVHAEKRTRAGRGALDLMNLQDIPIAQGTEGTDNEKELKRKIASYEFENCPFPVDKTMTYSNGSKLLHNIFAQAAEDGNKLTVLAISSHRDLWRFMQSEETLVQKVMTKLVSQGGFWELENDNVQPRIDAANLKFDMKAAEGVFKFCVDNKIPMRAFTKDATFATNISDEFCKNLHDDGSMIGRYIRYAQVAMDLDFYESSRNPETRFSRKMNQEWYLANKTTWFDTHSRNEPYPDMEAVKPYLNKLTAYDCLAAVGSCGDDFMDALGVRLPWDRSSKVLDGAEVTPSGNLIVHKPETAIELLFDGKVSRKVFEYLKSLKDEARNWNDPIRVVITELEGKENEIEIPVFNGKVETKALDYLKSLKHETSDNKNQVHVVVEQHNTVLIPVFVGKVSPKDMNNLAILKGKRCDNQGQIWEKGKALGHGIVMDRPFHQNYQDPKQQRIDGPKMAVAIRALTRGSLLAVEQKLEKVDIGKI
jgi:inosine-uridine nucleoside N-ribohydrolase